jgi:MYXO-CTERM domain-containing protein
VQFGDGTWHTIGIASTGTGIGNPGTFARIDNAVSWVEENSGIDITPCHDVDGTWNPTPHCQKFFAGGGTGYGGWVEWCDGTPAGGSSDSCGEPFDAIPDEDPPTVTITAPADGTEYEGTSATIDVIMDADDGSGWGVKEIALEINGDIQQLVDEAAPWAFEDVTFPEGQWILVAVATDWADHEVRSAAVGIGVGQEAPDTPPPSDDGGADDGGTDDGGGTGDGSDDGDGDGDDDGDFTPGDSDRENDDGCGCTTGGIDASGAVWLLVPVGLLARRRRRRWRGALMGPGDGAEVGQRSEKQD